MVERLHLFVRNKFPFELKFWAWPYTFKHQALGGARALSECRRVSNTAVWKRVVKLKQRLTIAFERKPRRFIALDETCVNVNGECYWVYSAIEVESNEIVHMRVYPSRNRLKSESFLRDILKLCDGRPEFITDNAPMA